MVLHVLLVNSFLFHEDVLFELVQGNCKSINWESTKYLRKFDPAAPTGEKPCCTRRGLRWGQALEGDPREELNVPFNALHILRMACLVFTIVWSLKRIESLLCWRGLHDFQSIHAFKRLFGNLQALIEKLKGLGEQIKQLELQKRAAVEVEDYDAAKVCKVRFVQPSGRYVSPSCTVADIPHQL